MEKRNRIISSRYDAKLEETVSLMKREERVILASPFVQKVNTTFNDSLDLLKQGRLDLSHPISLGLPSIYLRSAGVPNINLIVRGKTLNQKSSDPRHSYDLDDIKNLVLEIQRPWAIFRYGDANKALNLIIGLEKNDKQFLVGLSLIPHVKDKYIEINSVRNVFPRDNIEWLRWIQQGKAIRIDEKAKIQAIITKHGMNHRAFDNVDLNLIAKIVKNFVNPTFEAIKYTLDEQIVFDPSPSTKVINEVLGIDGYVIIDDPQSLTYFDEAIKSSKHISVQLGKALPDSECKRIGCPVKSATVLVECDNIKERFLIAPGLKKQEEFQQLREDGKPLPDVFHHAKHSIRKTINNTTMEYTPTPLDLSSVELTPIEKELVQMVAERSHQAWYAARRQEGITVEQNPLMKPWSDLTAEERVSSLDSAEQAVKAAKAKFGTLDKFASGRAELNPAAVVDAIAENAHEVWAKQRMDAGWTYGEVRDNDAKKHPMLIPYSEVPEKEKEEYDRDYGRHVVSSLQTLSRFHYSIGGKDLYLKDGRLINEQGEALLRGVVGTPRIENLNGKEYLYYETRENDKITMNFLSEEGKALFPENLTRYYIDNSDRDIDLYDLMPVIHLNGRDYLQLRHNIGAAADGTQEFRFECLNPDTWEALLISKTPVEPDHSVKGGLRTGLCDSKGFYQGVDLLISPEGKAGLIKRNDGQDVALAFDRPFNMSDAAADVIVKGENIILQKPSMGNISVFDQKTGACLVNEEQGEIIERRPIPAIGKKETYVRLNGIEIPLKRLVENRKASKLAAADGKSEHRKGVSGQGTSTSIGNQTEIPVGFIKAVADDELRQDRNRPADPSRSPEKVYDSILYPDENEALGAIGTVGHAVRDENGDKVVVGIRYDEGTGKTICKREKVDDIKKKFGVDDAEDKRNVIIPVKVGDQIHELKVPKNLAEDLARGKSVTVSEIRINYDPFLGACAITKDYQKVHYYELSNSEKIKEARQQKAQAAKQSLSSPEPKKASGGKKI